MAVQCRSGKHHLGKIHVDRSGSAARRLTFFSDAVFAIAITLLIIEIHVPHPEVSTDKEWLITLANLIPNFAGFILSFIVVGAMWVAHHRVFGMLRRLDPTLVWPNLVLLMAVAFMPFSTALMSSHSAERVPELFYAFTLIVAGLLQIRLIRRALREPFLKPDVSAADIAMIRRRSLALPIMASIAFVLGFFWPGFSNLPLVLMPGVVVLFARWRRGKRPEPDAGAVGG
ncbi:TMEM175 family protein [Luteibacter rhizovicinus]|uniref:TMEM175 family protein n=1 Tax=Luteibacter rhizovicinus TaxID=242606 RepID=UPI001049749A|nr:TMEM175 family protein [Luteibacter rhizovicinus]